MVRTFKLPWLALVLLLNSSSHCLRSKRLNVCKTKQFPTPISFPSSIMVSKRKLELHKRSAFSILWLPRNRSRNFWKHWQRIYHLYCNKCRFSKKGRFWNLCTLITELKIDQNKVSNVYLQSCQSSQGHQSLVPLHWAADTAGHT